MKYPLLLSFMLALNVYIHGQSLNFVQIDDANIYVQSPYLYNTPIDTSIVARITITARDPNSNIEALFNIYFGNRNEEPIKTDLGNNKYEIVAYINKENLPTYLALLKDRNVSISYDETGTNENFIRLAKRI